MSVSKTRRTKGNYFKKIPPRSQSASSKDSNISLDSNESRSVQLLMKTSELHYKSLEERISGLQSLLNTSINI